MFDVMADWMNMPLLAHRYMGGAPKRNGMKHTFIAPYGTFKCKNNDEILISIQKKVFVSPSFPLFAQKTSAWGGSILAGATPSIRNLYKRRRVAAIFLL